jgi:pentatricopeptide repeat protein
MLYSMEERLGVAPDAESYRMVVGLCIKMDQFNTAFDVWEHMQSALPGRAHDKGTYKHLMFGCEKYENAFMRWTRSAAGAGPAGMRNPATRALCRIGAYSQLVRVATGMVGAGIIPAPTELMQLRERLLRTKQERVWDDIKALCMKADKTNLWAIKDAQYRKEVCLCLCLSPSPPVALPCAWLLCLL